MAVVNLGMLIAELSALAVEAYEIDKHAGHLLGDAAHFVLEERPETARVSLRIAERVLGESPLAIEVSALHDELAELLLAQQQHGPIPASWFEPRKQVRSPNKYADAAVRAFQVHQNWRQAEDLAELEMLS